MFSFFSTVVNGGVEGLLTPGLYLFQRFCPQITQITSILMQVLTRRRTKSDLRDLCNLWKINGTIAPGVFGPLLPHTTVDISEQSRAMRHRHSAIVLIARRI